MNDQYTRDANAYADWTISYKPEFPKSEMIPYLKWHAFCAGAKHARQESTDKLKEYEAKFEEFKKRTTDAELNSSLLVAKNKELEECISELRYELGQERISDLKNSGIEEEFIKIKEERDFYITRTLDLYQEIHKLWERLDEKAK